MTAARGDAPSTLRLISAVSPNAQTQVLRNRAEHLRHSAGAMHELVAQAYRRRAAELELEAWLTELQRGEAGAAA
ncbi:MAG: hypothetical protein AB7W59_02360 [Acidimicrobiia bacterium]